jgi:hypothetical protein
VSCGAPASAFVASTETIVVNASGATFDSAQQTYDHAALAIP